MFQVAAALVFTVGICTKPPCGLPPFINQLPIDGQEKLREIWKNYKEGMECDNEHQQTREYIHLLPDGLKHIIFAGRCGPSFLRNVSKTIRDEFRSVWFNHRLSEQEKELRLKKLAYSLLSGESLALFHKWDEELQIRKAEFAEKVANLSPDARDSLEKWKTLKFKVMNSKNLKKGLLMYKKR
uniref:Secreted protein n=1 Tax=Syphacia muris TaxID=451379 RepID=A0A0N5A8H8_9BILA